MNATQLIDSSIQRLRHIQSAPEKIKWCEEYSVYDGCSSRQEEILSQIHGLTSDVYQAGLVIANYAQVIDRWDLSQRYMDLADSEWLRRQPYLSVLATIAWHFRRDHFMEGSLINKSIASGALLRLFLRLKEVSPTPGPAVTMKELLRSDCGNLPEEPGVYWVLAPEGFRIRFHERPYHPKSKLYAAQTLQNKLDKTADQKILYIGKAQGKRGLRQRLRQYVNYGQGKTNIHQGGRAIWQIEENEFLLLGYEVSSQADVRERQLLQGFKEKNHSYPLANWRK